MEKGLVEFFTNYIAQKPIFKNKAALQDSFIPDKVLYRSEQLEQVAGILAPCLRGERPSNLFVYGKTGTGKTLASKFVTSQMLQVCVQRGIPVKAVYINCKMKKVADTEYRLVAQLAREFGKAIPPTGLPTDEVYKAFYSAIDGEKSNILLILDEIDELADRFGNDILYNLTRINSELKYSKVSMIGISNRVAFTDGLDPRVKSSLSEEEVVFPPYNALQLKTILEDRSKDAFEEGVIEDGVLEKCAALAARDHGDARRALELLRVAGEVAERQNNRRITLRHLDDAEAKIEKDRFTELVSTHPKQHQLVLYAVLLCSGRREGALFTGEIYDKYMALCANCGLRTLTQRRIGDIIAELDMIGFLNAKVISKGRYGRTREITLSVPEPALSNVRSILKEELGL